MSESLLLQRFEVAAEFQIKYLFILLNVYMHDVLRWEFFSLFFFMFLNYLAERRHRGHLVSLPIVALSYALAL